MKHELEDRIFKMREQKLKQTLGKDFSRRLKHYIALMKEEQRAHMNSRLAEQTMMSKAFSLDPPSFKSDVTMRSNSQAGKK